MENVCRYKLCDLIIFNPMLLLLLSNIVTVVIQYYCFSDTISFVVFLVIQYNYCSYPIVLLWLSHIIILVIQYYYYSYPILLL